MNVFDRIISFFSPTAAAKRMAARESMSMLSGFGKRKYDSGKTGKRLSNWGFARTGPNSLVDYDNGRTRERARDFARNNPYARKAVRTIPVTVVGTGIRPAFSHPNKSITDSVSTVWKKWAETTACDFDGTKTLYGIQKMVMRAIIESGGCLIRKVVDKTANEIGLELQVIEIDHLDDTRDGPQRNGGYVRNGIEVNKKGKVVAYWIYDRHPSDQDFAQKRVSKRRRAMDIIHLYDEERPGQKMGMPLGHASMVKLKDYDEYEEAQLIRQKIAACFSVFITQQPAVVAGTEQKEGYQGERVEPGMINYMGPGEDVSFGNPPVTEGYDSYSRRVLQGIAAGYDMTYENLTGDLSNVNFSSGRMGWIDFGRFISDWQQNLLIPRLCHRVWGWFEQFAVLRGVFPEEGFDLDLKVSWTPPHREFIDPLKEVRALQEQVKAGFISWQEAVRKLGYNPEEIIEQLAQDKKNFDDNGIVLSIDMSHELAAPDGIIQHQDKE